MWFLCRRRDMVIWQKMGGTMISIGKIQVLNLWHFPPGRGKLYLWTQKFTDFMQM